MKLTFSKLKGDNERTRRRKSSRRKKNKNKEKTPMGCLSLSLSSCSPERLTSKLNPFFSTLFYSLFLNLYFPFLDLPALGNLFFSLSSLPNRSPSFVSSFCLAFIARGFGVSWVRTEGCMGEQVGTRHGLLGMSRDMMERARFRWAQ